MLSFVVCLLILGLAGVSNGAPFDSDSDSEVVSMEVMVPRSYTREEYFQSIVDYWTPERMASAQPVEPIIVNNDNYEIPFFDNRQQVQRAEQVLTSSTFVSGPDSAIPSTTGKAFFAIGNLNYVCSGSVVNAKNLDTVVTAGHCVYNNTGKIWFKNWIFVPHYVLGSKPLGTYTSRLMSTTKGWMDNKGFNDDVAIVLMNRNSDNGKHIQEMTGGLGITLNAPKAAKTHAFGYPMNINKGETMSSCDGQSSTNALLQLLMSFNGPQLKCDMKGGASGGPWIQQYNPNTKLGQQVSLTSFEHSFSKGNNNGPHFTETNIGKLFRENENL